MLIPVPSIRNQLLLIALVVFILPWIGIKTIREMESLLRQQQVQSLMNTATTVRDGIKAANDRLYSHHQRLETSASGSEVIISVLPERIRIDGYADDWPDEVNRFYYDSKSHLLDGKPDTGLSFNLIAGYQPDGLALLFDIRDDKLYQGSASELLARHTDQLFLGLKYPDGSTTQYVIGSDAPGWLNVFSVNQANRKENRIRAELQIKQQGYRVEILIPNELVTDEIAFSILDRDDKDTERFAQIGNVHPDNSQQYGLLFGHQASISTLLLPYLTDKRRIMLLDKRTNILADSEQMQTTSQTASQESGVDVTLFDRLYRLFLIADAPINQESGSNYRLDGDFVQSALSGTVSHQFQQSADGEEFLSVAVPITMNNQVVSALVIQDSIQDISKIRQHAILNIIYITFLAIIIVIAVLLLYAALLVRRIRRLNRQLQGAVSDDGRLYQAVPRSLIGDEIGDLNRGIVNIVDRLQEYQRYLETMASKLSHELRTPLAVVQSSLENLKDGSSQVDHNELLERANDGLQRLRTILTNLTEASRLENALSTTELEAFDLVKVVEGCIEGYRQAYPIIQFESSIKTNSVMLSGSPELIAQMLDKLVSNAMDFHLPGTAIRISIEQGKKYNQLCVSNKGPVLPDNIVGTLFDSMVSERINKDDTPHLGLGLFIARTIAEFHGGNIIARNQSDGVSIIVSFPLQGVERNG